MEISYSLWQMGWLQWGFELNILTKKAQFELYDYKKENPELNFEELAEKVRTKKLLPR
jgi:hypothetical protein